MLKAAAGSVGNEAGEDGTGMMRVRVGVGVGVGVGVWVGLW